MNLVIYFTGYKKIRLELFEHEDLMDHVDFSFDSNLDTVLIEAVDKLLKRNRITLPLLSEVKIAGDVDPNSSAFKIAQTWIEAVKTFKNELN